MTGVNKVILLGNLGNDPDMRYMPNGEPVANISIATSANWTDKNTGEKREKTEWHRIVAYRRLAEIIGQYCKKRAGQRAKPAVTKSGRRIWQSCVCEPAKRAIPATAQSGQSDTTPVVSATTG